MWISTKSQESTVEKKNHPTPSKAGQTLYETAKDVELLKEI